MGLGYFLLFAAILGGGALAAVLFRLARRDWNTPGMQGPAVLFFLLAALCAAGAVFFLMIVLRELFHF